MNTDYTAKITEIFYSVDEFCKQIEPQFKKKRLAKTEKRGEIALLRWATAKLSPFSSSFTSLATEYSRLSTPKWSAKSGDNTFPSYSLTIALWNVSKWFLSNFICFSTTVVWAIAPASRSLTPPPFGCVTTSDREGTKPFGDLPQVAKGLWGLRFKTAPYYQWPRRNRPMAVEISQYRWSYPAEKQEVYGEDFRKTRGRQGIHLAEPFWKIVCRRHSPNYSHT